MSGKLICFPSNVKLLNVKILQSRARDSICYIRYPYILKLTYSEEWDESYTTYIPVDKMLIPVVNYQHHTTRDYTFKYKNLQDIEAKISEMEQCGIKVENKIKRVD